MKTLSRKLVGILSIGLLSFGLMVVPSKKASATITCKLSNDHCTTIVIVDPVTGQSMEVKVKGTRVTGPIA